MSKRRSPRLLKKLHLGPFQELGFALALSFQADLSETQINAFMAAFLADCIEANGFCYGGGLSDGWVHLDCSGPRAEKQRQTLSEWLATRPELIRFEAGPLIDVWYGTPV